MFLLCSHTHALAHTPRTEVLTAFREISACSGGKSQDKKIGIIRKLLLNCAKDGSVVKFLVRGALTDLTGCGVWGACLLRETGDVCLAYAHDTLLWLARLPTGLQTKLRCKLAEPTVLTALAQALVLQKPAAVAEVENTKAGQVRGHVYV